MTEQWRDYYTRCPQPHCRRLVSVLSVPAHKAAHRRVNVVHAARMDMNAKGVDFQPDQQWTGKRTRRRTKR